MHKACHMSMIQYKLYNALIMAIIYIVFNHNKDYYMTCCTCSTFHIHRGITRTNGAFFRLLLQFCGARLTMSSETSNASRTRYYLAFEHLKLVYEASFSSYGVICLLCCCWRSGLLQRQSCPQLTCLEADRFKIYYRIAAQVQKNRVSKLWKLSRSYACDCCAKHCRHVQLNCG